MIPTARQDNMGDDLSRRRPFSFLGVAGYNKHMYTQDVARQFVKTLSDEKRMKKALVVGLYGELGAGKTTFVQEVALSLGITQSVTSPTFVIQKVYKLTNQPFKHLVHIDAYRLESSEELKAIGWNETISSPDNLVFVEWADKVEGILSNDVLKISFEVKDENTRVITIDNAKS
jgi:tRNA threonylcarbamoyladenosine biosynthesis protein TsaE|tara:strand:+ start:14635 stop:15156 length:522 start_codon:yes stop_codon:yes gene_type:complete